MVKKKAKSNLDHQITYGAKDIKKKIKELEKKIKNAKSVPKKDELRENEIPKEEIKLNEDVSNFSIQDTILSSESKKQNWQGENLEDFAGRRINKTNSYQEIKSQRPTHSAELSLKDIYSSNERSENVYDEANSNAYDEKSNLYESGSDDKFLGHIKEDIKGYSEIEENRRGGRSMLEISGFEDKEKQKERESHRAKY